MLYSDASVAHIQPHETRYGTNGYDLYMPGMPAVFCRNRIEAKNLAESHGFSIYSAKAKSAPKRVKAVIYGSLHYSDPDFGPMFHRCSKRKLHA